MTALHAFWAFLAYVNALSPGHTCTAVTQSTHSTHSTPATEYPVVYGGNCGMAFRIALASHGAIAWIVSLT